MGAGGKRGRRQQQQQQRQQQRRQPLADCHQLEQTCLSPHSEARVSMVSNCTNCRAPLCIHATCVVFATKWNVCVAHFTGCKLLTRPAQRESDPHSPNSQDEQSVCTQVRMWARRSGAGG